jgi:hypothetical protein
MHEHVKRLLDIDLVDGSADSAIRWARINAEILAKGVIDEESYDKWKDSTQAAERQTE